MLIPAVFIQLVAVVEPFPAEVAKGMSLKTCLVDCPGPVVSSAHMLLQLFVGKEFVFVRKYLLVTSAKIAHLLVVGRADVSV
jgi:hypothetical protein